MLLYCCTARHRPQVARYIEQMASDLELAAHPALDALTGKVRLPAGWLGQLSRPDQLLARWAAVGCRCPTICSVLVLTPPVSRVLPALPWSHNRSRHQTWSV